MACACQDAARDGNRIGLMALYRPALFDGGRPALGEGNASSHSALDERHRERYAMASAVLVTTPGRQ